ncbi:hypothetical protein L1049_012542 [Liquidambar formosana]|uniref:Uncharacterized protein n=1 Tax=Liquidambar formosana TaxID=63359 RepID=A0AAP0N7C0_LIQFO
MESTFLLFVPHEATGAQLVIQRTEMKKTSDTLDVAALHGSDTVGLEHLFLAIFVGRQAVDEFLREKVVVEFLKGVENKSIQGTQEGVRRSEHQDVFDRVFPEFDGEGLTSDDATSIVETFLDRSLSIPLVPRQYADEFGHPQA